MKKSVCIMMVLMYAISVMPNAFANGADQLMTVEQARIFEKEKLDVRRKNVYGTFSNYYWQATKGFELITEEQFFRTAGFEEEARKCEGWKKEQKEKAKEKENSMNPKPDKNDTAIGISVLMPLIIMNIPKLWKVLGTSGIVGVMVWDFMRARLLSAPARKWAPYPTVKKIATVYNQQLMIRIQRDF